VADDSPANQLVAATWLRKDGHHVDVVANGIEAVEAVRARPYDIVFMDMFMPEMDGMAATAAIRRLPPPAGTVPIVALTANVMAGDRERFLAAGMNGVLAKPVTGRILAEALLRHLHAADDGESDSAISATRNTPPQVLDTEHLARLGRGLTADTLASLIRTCIEDVRARAGTITDAVTLADATRLRREAHALRGSAANYGLAALAEIASRIEAATAAGKLDEASRIADELPGAAEAACSALAASAEQAAAV
jgi:CheY-like chemotaxis protein/HPt (histidine-containing phosphotransfer) domain-containing protein